MAGVETTDAIGVPASDEALLYKSVSKAAVVACVLAGLTLTAFLLPVLLILPVLGVCFALYSFWQLRRYPDLLTGTGLAISALVLNVMLATAAAAMHTYIYRTEVPDGYTRISFADLQPDEFSHSPIPKAARDLNGKRVFVKGYIHPSVSGLGRIKSFVLVPDFGTCCFGGQPKLNDIIEVKLAHSDGIQYNMHMRRLGGILRVNDNIHQVAGGLNGGFYSLEADYVQ